ncbi:2932_t:CDS:2 [Ambispora gerdemannii]|uniref:2932_t:CDS:1 n=1 Tax=Ambispora gerdemannii TaxID=144530 RepID=A0A9N8YN89_9GLOM|nr:2932_t:CDS:2 [Ambispora gerdemannii]
MAVSTSSYYSLVITETKTLLCPVPECTKRLTPGTRLCEDHSAAILQGGKNITNIGVIKLPTSKTNEFVTLFPLSKSSERYNSLVTSIMNDWKKQNVTDLRIETIAEIYPSPSQVKTFNEYKAMILSMRNEGDDDVDNIYNHNKVMALYHGTHQHCGPLLTTENGQLQSNPQILCGSSDCGVCGVILNGFDPNKIGHNERGETFQRLGKGFYFAPHPSKAHYYSRGAQKCHSNDPTRKTQVLLRCLVAIGKPYHENIVQQKKTAPPEGYDSVYGAVGTCRTRGHGSLNWPEYAVYDPRAAIAVDYIVYSYTSTSEF